MGTPETLVEALSLPDGEARGFRFLGLDREERYYPPYAAMRAEAQRRAALLSDAHEIIVATFVHSARLDELMSCGMTS